MCELDTNENGLVSIDEILASIENETVFSAEEVRPIWIAHFMDMLQDLEKSFGVTSPRVFMARFTLQELSCWTNPRVYFAIWTQHLVVGPPWRHCQPPVARLDGRR